MYRYTEAPDFEILLFGYSVDGGTVQVVDLASGEKIPADVMAALEDETVTKWAFNANFERVCLSRCLGLPTGDYLDPAPWRCSMVWSAYMGLPQSLAEVGEVLGLEKQKLTEGKDLIRYFCVPCAPTKANGGRTRNLPVHSPEKWERFKAYNKNCSKETVGELIEELRRTVENLRLEAEECRALVPLGTAQKCKEHQATRMSGSPRRCTRIFSPMCPMWSYPAGTI